MSLLPTWKEIFNSELGTWFSADAIVEAARSAGYHYIAWMGMVYHTPDHGSPLTNSVCHVFDIPVADLPNTGRQPDRTKEGDDDVPF